MKAKLLLTSLLLSVIFLLGGCDKPVVTTDPTGPYKLSVDKISVGINEEVYITVTSANGIDVTDDWNLCDNSGCRTSRKFTWTTPGVYTISAHNKIDTSMATENEIDVTVTGTIYTISANHLVIYEKESVTFTFKENVDGVEQPGTPAGFYPGIKGGERFGSMTHMFPTAGVYTIDGAKVDMFGKPIITTNNTVEIVVKKKAPIGYEENFYRRSLIVEGTGTWCNSCPKMVTVLDRLNTSYLDDRTITLALHTIAPQIDECYVETGNLVNEVADAYNLWEYPYYIIDWHKSYSETSSQISSELTPAKMSGFIEASHARYDKTLVPGIAINTTLTGRKLDINVKVTPREAGDYYVGVYFVEDNKETYQSGTPNEKAIQMNIAHKNISTGDNLNKLDSKPSLNAKQEYTVPYSINIAERYPIEKCRIVAYICKVDKSAEPLGYFCANATTCKVGGSVAYQYEPIFE